ncbi:hypothetical protein PHYPO_G00076050 [Pangasianodon hypophthalmus]|uniref:C2 NT-type domain-containing protein n=1 Tax=Pangasianodon hypophthalmus TaxID=310915 RepID=A0A5N5LKN5_PANHP|nr:hypothetical protein PHYPO_G00076050 [Pangasianodon hypophthalmus]
MSSVWKRLQRVGKKATRFQFVASYQELVVECTKKWQPDKLRVVWTRRNRRICSKLHSWQPGIKNPYRGMVVWPVPENVDITVTLFKDPHADEFEDKDWTFVIENETAKGQRKVLASVDVNLKKFASATVTQTDLTLKLKPLSVKVIEATLKLSLSCVFLKEGRATDEDMQSVASLMSVKPTDIGNLDDFNESDEEADKTSNVSTAASAPASFKRRLSGTDDLTMTSDLLQPRPFDAAASNPALPVYSQTVAATDTQKDAPQVSVFNSRSVQDHVSPSPASFYSPQHSSLSLSHTLKPPSSSVSDSSQAEANSGEANSGEANSGDANSGEANSGEANSGDANSGDANSQSIPAQHTDKQSLNQISTNLPTDPQITEAETHTSEDTHTALSHTEDTHSAVTHTEDTHSAVTHTEDTHSAVTHTEDTHSAVTHTEDTHSAVTHTEDTHSAVTHTEETQTVDICATDTHTEDTHTTEANITDTHTPEPPGGQSETPLWAALERVRDQRDEPDVREETHGDTTGGDGDSNVDSFTRVETRTAGGGKTSDHAGDMQKLDLGELETTIYKPKTVLIEEKLECDITSLIPSAPPTAPLPSLALAPLLAFNDTTLNISNMERTDADSEVTNEGPLWASLERKGTRKWKEGISPGEIETEQADLDGGHIEWMAESKKQEEVENFPNQQDEGVNIRVVGFSSEPGKESMEKTDEDESSRKIQKPNDGNKLSEEEIRSPSEDQDFVSEQEETCSESSGLVKGIISVLYKGYETVTSMLMQPSPTETDNPEDTESGNQQFEILPPEPFCDTNLIKATKEATEEHYKAPMIKEGISTQISCEEASHVTSGLEPSGRSLVDCLRLAASEVEREAESVKNKPEAETSNGKRTVRKVKISKEESSSVGGQTWKNEQKPKASESSEPNIEKSRKPSSTPETNTSPDNNNALGLHSTKDVPRLKEVDFDDIASEEHSKNANEEPGEIKPDLQKKKTYVSPLVLTEPVEEELEFEMGQEDVGTVWFAELYMDEGPKESPASSEIINTKPVSVLQSSQAEEKNPPQVAKPHETKQKGASVQEVKQNVPSGFRAIVLPQHNTNKGSGSKNEEQMRGSTIPPSECTNKVNTQAELAAPQTRKGHLLIEVPISDPSKSKIATYQSDDIKPSLETDKEKPTDLKDYLGTGIDQADEVKQSLDQAKDKPDHVSRPSGTSKDQTVDDSRSSEIAEELGDNIKRSLETDIEQPDDVKAKDQPGNANTCLRTAKDQPDYVKRAAKEQLEITSRSLGTVKEELEDVQRSLGIAKEQPDDVQRSVGTVKEELMEVKTSLGDVKKQLDYANMCSELVKDQPDDATKGAKKQVDVQKPLGAVIEQPDDVSRSVGTDKEQLHEVKGLISLSKEQPDDVIRALDAGKKESDDTSAKEQSGDVKDGSLKNISPGSSVVPQPVPSPQHAKSPDSLTETTEEPSAVSEESFLLEKIRQMAEDTDTLPLSDPVPLPVPVPVSRPRKRLAPSESDFDLPPTPPLPHRVCTTSPEHADQRELPASEVTDETETCKSQNERAMVLEDERKETIKSKANDETLKKENVPAEDELDEAHIETLKPTPVPDDACELQGEDSSRLGVSGSALKVESESAVTENDVRNSACEEPVKTSPVVLPRSKKKNIPPPVTLQEVRRDTLTPEQVKNVTDNPLSDGTH